MPCAIVSSYRPLSRDAGYARRYRQITPGCSYAADAVFVVFSGEYGLCGAAFRVAEFADAAGAHGKQEQCSVARAHQGENVFSMFCDAASIFNLSNARVQQKKREAQEPSRGHVLEVQRGCSAARRRTKETRQHVVAQHLAPTLAPAPAPVPVQAAPPVKLSTSSLGGDFVPLSSGVTAKKRMNLLELERENKKKKIKSSVGGAGEGGGTGRSLTALAGLFNSARR